jgi:hypothetical protein
VLPKSGDVLVIDKTASVQFREPFMFRVIRRHDWSTYEGWVWLDGYELNADGDAVERRSVFVQVAGLKLAGLSTPRRPGPRRQKPHGVAL